MNYYAILGILSQKKRHHPPSSFLRLTPGRSCATVQAQTCTSRFLFTVGNWLLPRVENEALVEIMQPVPAEANEVWTDKLETAIEWFLAKLKKRILKVDPELFRRKPRKPKLF
jgi:hypothetical protein